MKPGEEMHSSVEEVDLDPCDLYIDLGSLIVEGRLPGLTDRGFGEGPHCPPPHAQTRHQCNPIAPECQKYEQIQKHMLLLWKNGIPMSIEVLLYPSCCAGLAPIQNVDTASVPEMSYVLLEQWTVHMLPRRVPDASISPRGLLQAIRSFLYFSQLCAWLSLSGGKSPQNVHYRVCVPGEAFSSKFVIQPDCHIFPIANVGRNSAMKVLVKSHPRCGEIPTVLCQKHSLSHHPQKTMKQLPKMEVMEKLPEESLSGAEGEYICGVMPLAKQQRSRTSSPADSMLGESLLDPPNSLCMYPKRYQSPSRCGSPSLEVPEHLMFGKGTTVKREAQIHRLNQEMQNRSRPQRRVVVERSLKKTLGEDIRASGLSEMSCHSFDKRQSQLNNLLTFPEKEARNKDVMSYFCVGDDLQTLPKAEMETVLHRLRNRGVSSRNSREESQCTYLLTDSVKCRLNKPVSMSEYLQEMTIGSKKLSSKNEEPVCNSKISSLNKSQQQTYNSSKQPSSNITPFQNTQKYSKVVENEFVKSVHTKYQPEESVHYDSQSKLKDKFVSMPLKEVRNIHLQNSKRFYRVQDSHHNALDRDYSIPHSNQVQSFPHNTVTVANTNKSTYQGENNSSPKLSSVNIKKYSDSLPSSDELIDETVISDAYQVSPLLRRLLKSSYTKELSIDEIDLVCHAIPSAADKAQFRRSLDSATSLVFHQKNGLPLTSSPAPIRKSGTCFDFDSSLTTVSAIKRALFEKEPEEEDAEQPKTMHISISAPASITVSSLLGTFEESVLNGRLEPVSTVEGFTAEIGASGSFCPRHITLPVTVFFYTLQETDKVTSPYLGHINLGKREYHVPKKGTVQVTLFNPHRTVVKMYVVRYDLSDMPSNCQTFLRQRTLYMPTDASENDVEAQKWLRYLIHLRFASSKSGRIYLHTDIRVIIFRKSDLDAAAVHGQRPYELRSFTQGPANPKFSPRKP